MAVVFLSTEAYRVNCPDQLKYCGWDLSNVLVSPSFMQGFEINEATGIVALLIKALNLMLSPRASYRLGLTFGTFSPIGNLMKHEIDPKTQQIQQT